MMLLGQMTVLRKWPMKKVALIRVGVDSGSGGIQGPLFSDGTFEYIPIPDGFSVDSRTYGNTVGRRGHPLVEYFPASRRHSMKNQSIHFDPEFETCTYGDPTSPKAGLKRLEGGDLLVFYCGLQGWDFSSPAELFIMGFFLVEAAGRVGNFSGEELRNLFGENFHVRHPKIFESQKKDLVLVKGSQESRLFDRAVPISSIGKDSRGRSIKILSPKMRDIFGDFNGHLSIQRSPPRWVLPQFSNKAADFILSLQ